MEVKQQLSKIGQELEIMINKVVFASTNDVCSQIGAHCAVFGLFLVLFGI